MTSNITSEQNISIAFCVNNTYAQQLAVTIFSILINNPQTVINFYIFTSDFSETNIHKLQKFRISFPHVNFTFIFVKKEIFSKLQLNINYISIETYYRYIIADYLPNIDKILYIDADTIINGPLSALWKQDISDYYIAGVEDIYINEIHHKSTINFTDSNLYVNAGVLLMNLNKIRSANLGQTLITKTAKLFNKIKFQDQDILNIVCKNHILKLDSKYNFTSGNIKSEKNQASKAIIIHYTGSDKPWHPTSKHPLKKLYLKYQNQAQKILNKKVKLGLIIDEFFGGAGTGFGGYGALARQYLAKYLPDEDLHIDILLGRGNHKFFATKYHEDNVDLYKLPQYHFASKLWLKQQKYDIYLSIELTTDWILKHEKNPKTKLILWIQDPRPWYEWREIETMTLMPEPNYYNQHIYNTINKWYHKGRINFISQALYLNNKAKDLYRLQENTPINYIPNPIDIDTTFNLASYPKKNQIIFLGRLEDVKRGWLFCEIAKQLPEYEFYILGKINAQKAQTASFWERYKNISNLHFMGHVDGEEKKQFLRESKILVNTSIHEALPVSFLEALSYGVCLVSNRNPDHLTEKFGIWTGDILGNGFDKIDLYVNAIRQLMTNEKQRQYLAQKAQKYIMEIHDRVKITKQLKKIIFKELYGDVNVISAKNDL